MARIENHKYSIEEAFRECFYIVGLEKVSTHPDAIVERSRCAAGDGHPGSPVDKDG
jgi:hypothetical protein